MPKRHVVHNLTSWHAVRNLTSSILTSSVNSSEMYALALFKDHKNVICFLQFACLNTGYMGVTAISAVCVMICFAGLSGGQQVGLQQCHKVYRSYGERHCANTVPSWACLWNRRAIKWDISAGTTHPEVLNASNRNIELTFKWDYRKQMTIYTRQSAWNMLSWNSSNYVIFC